MVLHEQRWEVGTPAITWSTCWPQPAHVVLEQERQFTGRHMADRFPFEESCVAITKLYPLGY